MHQQKIDNNLIVKLSIDLSLAAILYCEELETAKKFVIARQLLKSATSIGANVMEAQNAESKIDFIHKMKIAAKEADETLYWLTLCELSPSYPTSKTLSAQVNQIARVLNAILSTSKKNVQSSTTDGGVE